MPDRFPQEAVLRDGRRVLIEDLAAYSLVHVSGAGQKRIDIDAAHGGAEQADRTQYAEPAADVVGDDERDQVGIFTDITEGAFLCIGGGDDLILKSFRAELFAEHLANNKKLGGRLCCPAGLADDVEAGLVQAVAEPFEE